MLENDIYHPINCDDYENLELACQHRFQLKLVLRGGETLQALAQDLTLRKKVEYLIVENAGGKRELRLDRIESFTHPQLGTVTINYN